VLREKWQEAPSTTCTSGVPAVPKEKVFPPERDAKLKKCPERLEALNIIRT